MNKKITLLLVCFAIVVLNSCKKDDEDTPPVENPVTTQQVLTDFASFVANPNYLDIEAKANLLKIAVETLNSATTDQNLQAAQNAWRAVRVPWEQTESFLFGPVDDFSYDPQTDTWPVNTTELDSLLTSNNPLLLADVDALEYSLKGYHPIEYVLFGVGGTRTAAQLTPRELQFVVSLSQSLANTTAALRISWDPSLPGNFTQEFITAGNGSTRFATRKDALIAMVSSMAHICIEVADGKMEVPLAAQDSQLVESQYAHNTTIDFRNNMMGVENVYLCRYTSTGKSLHDYVKSKDAALDLTIQQKINAAKDALVPIHDNYGIAIFTQAGQINAAQTAINDLEGALNLLNNFIHQHVTD